MINDQCNGGCGASGDCGCYSKGHSDGEKAAHLEVRSWTGEHLIGCDCDLCATIRVVAVHYADLVIDTVVKRSSVDPLDWERMVATIGLDLAMLDTSMLPPSEKVALAYDLAVAIVQPGSSRGIGIDKLCSRCQIVGPHSVSIDPLATVCRECKNYETPE